MLDGDHTDKNSSNDIKNDEDNSNEDNNDEDNNNEDNNNEDNNNENVTVKKQKWYHNKAASNALDNISTSCYILSDLFNALRKIPVLQFIFIPLNGFLDTTAYGLWKVALAFDSEIDLTMDDDQRKLFKELKGFHKGSAYFGFLSGIAVLATVMFPAIAPFMPAIAAAALSLSHAYWAGGEISHLINLIKTAPHDDTRNLAIAAQTSKVIYAGFGTLSIGLLTVSLLVSTAFPPAGAILLTASMACAVVGAIGLASSQLFNRIISRKQQYLDSTKELGREDNRDINEPSNCTFGKQHKPVANNSHHVDVVAKQRQKQQPPKPVATKNLGVRSGHYTPLVNNLKSPNSPPAPTNKQKDDQNNPTF